MSDAIFQKLDSGFDELTLEDADGDRASQMAFKVVLVLGWSLIAFTAIGSAEEVHGWTTYESNTVGIAVIGFTALAAALAIRPWLTKFIHPVQHAVTLYLMFCTGYLFWSNYNIMLDPILPISFTLIIFFALPEDPTWIFKQGHQRIARGESDAE